MNQRRFTIFAALLGIVIPVIWLTTYWIFLRDNPTLINWIMSSNHTDRVLLALWPSWILMIADPLERSIAIPVISIAINALLYGILGWIVWFGLHRKRAILGVVVVVVLVGWYFLLAWYVGGGM
ncbi:MAG: hypothetical protein R6X06_11550 [Gammaproteobacteria bacterium]